MFAEMSFKVGDQLPCRVPKCLASSSFGHIIRDCERSLVQNEEDGVDAFLQTSCLRRLTGCGPLWLQFLLEVLDISVPT